MHRRVAAAVALAVALGALAGCGSSDDSSTAPATVTTTSSVTTGAGTVTTTAPDTTVTTTTPTATDTTPAVTTTTTTSASGPTHAEYVAQVDGLCRTINAQTRQLNAKANAAVRSAKTEKEQLAALAPILKEGLGSQSLALKTIKAVARPPEDAAALASYFALLERQKTLLIQLADAATAGDVAAYKSVSSRSSALRTQARAKAVAFGFKECGSGKGDAA